ncbi:heme oxygenase-like protein [Phellopilus nigrolimitatus]|nr:heme oxygenase-like protein [Phellopilus nigrolimitatus]
MANAQIDFTQPLASVLKVATSVAHERAEQSQGAGWLTRGELDKDEYIRFLMMLFHVYNNLEVALEKHSAHPTLASTYNPTLLSRAPSLSSDISFLLGVPESSWEDHPVHKYLQSNPPAPFSAYISRIQHLANEAEDPSPLLAHAYVRYLGDLSGGQVIRRRIAKAYGIERDDGRGTQFYDFRQLGKDKPANMGDMRKIKVWFRDMMNQGAGDDASRKQTIAEEAVKVFELNEGLFKILKEPAVASSQISAVAPLGNPSPPPSPTALVSKPILVASAPEPEEKVYSLSSVLGVVLAVGIAHFALVIGGFTGARGFVKLEAAQHWFDELVQTVMG